MARKWKLEYVRDPHNQITKQCSVPGTLQTLRQASDLILSKPQLHGVTWPQSVSKQSPELSKTVCTFTGLMRNF
jgi:hypothetical protein